MFSATDKKTFAAIGLFETMSQLLGFIGAAKLPGGFAADATCWGVMACACTLDGGFYLSLQHAAKLFQFHVMRRACPICGAQFVQKLVLAQHKPVGLSLPAGVALPLLQQSVMFFNLFLTYTVLHKSLAKEQIAGALLVVAGVVLAAWPSDSGASVFSDVRPSLSLYN